jgi:ABC-type multidrug transport system ATPase subunit
VGVSLSQERAFYLRLSGRENLLFFARLRWRSRAAAARQVDELVEELELGDIASRRTDRCSTGMLQQLSFARSLLGSPDLLLLDEPTRSLDEGAIARLWGAIERRPEVALMIATHHADDAERCGSQLDLPL